MKTDAMTYRDMQDFPLKWRFTDPKFRVLPAKHLLQVRVLDVPSARRLSRFISDSGLHSEDPFQPNFFRLVESTEIGDSHGNDAEDSRIRKWLYRCALPFDQTVLLQWQPEWAVETTWKLLVKYWSDFYYPISDDLTVCDFSLQWALLFHHEHEIHFGTNRPRANEGEQGADGQPQGLPCWPCPP
jgi:hypothetical protein